MRRNKTPHFHEDLASQNKNVKEASIQPVQLAIQLKIKYGLNNETRIQQTATDKTETKLTKALFTRKFEILKLLI